MSERGSLVVVSGFSGSGKGTIMKRLIREYPNYRLSVSCTTRKPREGEENGVSYFFISQETFDRMVEEGAFLEHAGYVNHSYGTPRAWVEEQMEQGFDVLLEIEVQGAFQIRKQFPEAILLFVLPPSIAVLKQRLVGRGSEASDVIRQRFAQAAREVHQIDKYDLIVVNDDLDRAVEEVHRDIQTLKAAPVRCADLIGQMARELEALSSEEEG